jgi:trans-aconitate 2-methyltransferase
MNAANEATSTKDWAPDVYLAFAGYRARPAADFLPRISIPARGVLYDLGCGPGNVTAKLKAKWPDRDVVGVDSSPAMLDAARAAHAAPGLAFQTGDIARWSPPQSAALVFSNAALHWVGNHETLFPHLISTLMPSGTLAVQMPTGQEAPYQTCIEEVAARPQWRDKLAGAYQQTMPLAPHIYYDLLAPLAEEIDIWHTEYHHVLQGEDPVTAWVAGTALVPYTSLLTQREAQEFTAAYAAAVRPFYPPQADGRTLFIMRRLFILARRKA